MPNFTVSVDIDELLQAEDKPDIQNILDIPSETLVGYLSSSVSSLSSSVISLNTNLTTQTGRVDILTTNFASFSSVTTDVLSSKIDATDVSDFAKGQSRMALSASRDWHAGRVTYDRPALTVMTFGDSLTYNYGSLVTSATLIDDLPFQGYKLMAMDMYTLISGTSPLTGGLLPFGTNWITNQYIPLYSGTTLQWERGSYVRANRVSVAYLSGTGSAFLSAQYSVDGGSTWTNLARVNTAAATTEFSYITFNLASSRPTKVRTIAEPGSNVRLIGAGVYCGDEGNFAGEGGYTIVAASRGGLELTEVLTAATTETWMKAMSSTKTNIVLGTWNDYSTNWNPGSSIDIIKARADSGRVADWVFVTGIGGVTTSPAANMVQVMSAQRLAIRDWANRNNQNYIDWAGYLRNSYTFATELGYWSGTDAIHHTTKGYVFRQRYVSEILGKMLNRTDGFVSHNSFDLGFGFRMRSNPYGVYLENDGSYGGGLTVAGSTGFIGLESSTDTDPFKNMTLTYGGSEFVGLCLKWATNRQQGVPRDILVWNSNGPIDNRNMTLSSGYAMVQMTRAIATNVVPPASGSLVTFARISSNCMEYAFMPPNGIPIVMGRENVPFFTGTPDGMLASSGVVNLTSAATLLSTTSPLQALTLANGVEGQMKELTHVSSTGSGSAILSPTTKTGFSSVTFNNVGDNVILRYYPTYGWMIHASRGSVIA